MAGVCGEALIKTLVDLGPSRLSGRHPEREHESGVRPPTVDRRPVPPRRFAALLRRPLIVGQRRLPWRYKSARIAWVATTIACDHQSAQHSEPFVRVPVSGRKGSLGAVLMPLARSAGHGVVGLDTGLFADSTLGPLTLRPLKEAWL